MSRQKQEKIRTYKCDKCELCQSIGINIHQDLEESIGLVSGNWNLKQCTNYNCKFVWVDPFPVEEDIEKLYPFSYYTGEVTTNVTTTQSNNLLKLTYQFLANKMQLNQELERMYYLYLDKVKPGKLLEVGCGNGKRLAKFKELGWEVQGQDLSPHSAVVTSNNYQIPVYAGSLETASFEENYFDAIIINHVIEHVVDPVSLLAKCYQILKPNGVVMVITPNIHSHGHQIFQQDWMALDPPRHLHLFSAQTLGIVAAKAGFSKYETWTSSANAGFFALVSLYYRKYGYHQGQLNYSEKKDKFFNLISKWFQIQAKLVNLVQKNSGDECILKAMKSNEL